MRPVIECRTTYGGTAFDFFSLHSACCAALLEDPSGCGDQWVVAAAGTSHQVDDCHSPAQLAAWRQRITPPAAGNATGIFSLLYLGYEAAGLFESLPDPKPSATHLPLLYAHHPDWSLRFAADGAVTITALHQAALDAVRALLQCPLQQVNEGVFSIGTIVERGSAADYRRAVARVQQYIGAGDVFQANIARFWHAAVSSGDDLALYRRLRVCNPAPFSCVVRLGATSIVSASPERLLRIAADGMIDTRPIAGTRKIGCGDETDLLQQDLLLSPKERAEHIMLVDLERNDLGRICMPGTVEVDESMVVERYATVQHIVSNVRGKLRAGVDLVDVLATMFPGGTITGCPKIRCMEIIHALEQGARGSYTGGVGYIGWDGAVDINILIRSFCMQHDSSGVPTTLHWAAGAGIVSDSNPLHEQYETEHKAAGLLAALQGVT